jgi:Na+/H+-dicarboxylate symporter/ABC-type amino acid transport substrate-binding protein
LGGPAASLLSPVFQIEGHRLEPHAGTHSRLAGGLSVTEQSTERPRRLTLGTRILIGVLCGIAVGIFLGEESSPLEVLGKVYVGLLQMTVLPYVTVSLVAKIGRLRFEQARGLAGRACMVLLALWTISLLTVVVMPFSLPTWEAGSYFSSSLVERPQEFDFLGLYLPTNPFHSLANNVVPAVVLFSILLGVAMIAIEDKARLLDPLDVLGNALSRISNGVVKLSPWGTFALAAGAAGTLSPAEMLRLGGYVSTYTLAIVFLTIVVLPAFVSAATPHRLPQVLGKMRSALLTAFATGKLFPVLPMVGSGVVDLLVDRGVPEREARSATDVLVPLAYPFPNAGKVLAILFLPFAAWFVGRPLGLADYPLLLSVGLLSFFGSPVAAIPFLLDLFRLPSDLLALFLVAGIWCARIGDVLGVMHLAAFTLLCDAWGRGWLKLRIPRLLIVAGGVSLLGLGVLWLNHFVVGRSIASVPPQRDRVAQMESPFGFTDVAEGKPAPNPVPRQPGESHFERIRRAGELRVGYLEKNPPFTYRNANGDLVGLDVDLAWKLASELGLELRLIPFRSDALVESLAADHFDIAVGGLASSIDNFGTYFESTAYLQLHAALVVEDHRVPEFRTVEAMRKARGLRIGYIPGGRVARPEQREIPGAEGVAVAAPQEFLEGRLPDVDALLVTAEAGSIYTMIAPAYSVVIPEDIYIKVPVVVAAQIGTDLDRLLDVWIEIERGDGTIDALYDHWILGRETGSRGQRWSVIRDVLGWVD